MERATCDRVRPAFQQALLLRTLQKGAQFLIRRVHLLRDLGFFPLSFQTLVPCDALFAPVF
jgi:hypothetical protein